ncbi:predicted protein, partial [Haematococcus lacustris]
MEGIKVNKLVRHFGYPEVLRSFTFSWDWMMKGLILDKAHGNVLKVDRHKWGSGNDSAHGSALASKTYAQLYKAGG